MLRRFDRSEPLPWTAVLAVALAGLVSFVNFWATQPLLPLFTQLFSASKPAVGMTVSASRLPLPCPLPSAAYWRNASDANGSSSFPLFSCLYRFCWRHRPDA